MPHVSFTVSGDGNILSEAGQDKGPLGSSYLTEQNYVGCLRPGDFSSVFIETKANDRIG